MKVALVHDYLKEYGGAERVLRVLSDMYPEAPIYTAFRVKGSVCDKQFADRKIVESSWAWLIRKGNLYSPLRFLAPLIWRSFDLSKYDLVITSCSSYFARGFKVGDNTKVVAYCHTPPRFLYGYEMSINLMRYWIVRVYAVVVNHFLRIFDWVSSRRVDFWMANSKNVKNRIMKYYRKDSTVVYPPVDVEPLIKKSKEIKKKDYLLIVSRLVGAKGLVESALAAKHAGMTLKVVGESAGFSAIEKRLKKMRGVELLGRADDEQLAELYAGARGFLALAKEEDFGMTVVESMAAGTPVIAYKGGGFLETVIDGETGVFVTATDEKTISRAIRILLGKKWNREKMIEQAKKFSKENFKKRIKLLIGKIVYEK